MEKISVNYCSFRDLVSVPGIGDAHATAIIDLRAARGNITPELLDTIPHVGNMLSLTALFDFRSYVPFLGRTESPMAVSSPKKQVPSLASYTPRRGRPFEDAGGHFRFDSYPPPQVPASPICKAPEQQAPHVLEDAPPGNLWCDAPTSLWSDRLPKGREGPSNPKHSALPKTITYDGKGSWQAFFAKFTSFADECNWSAKRRKNNLCWCLA